MAWTSIIGQERVQRILQAAFTSKRLPHALLFYGLEGVGKDAVAIELARTLNCEKGVWDACGVCPGCMMMNKLQHPSVKLVFPLPRGKNEGKGDGPYDKLDESLMEIILEQIEMKSNNPYHRIHIAGGNEIKISSIRDIKRESVFRSQAGGRAVVIITEADKMNTEASNSFLKTLEEPSGDLLLILTTNRRDALLPTITSRCQHIRFDPLSEDNIVQALGRDYDYPHETRLIAAKLSNGSYGKAIELLDEQCITEREKIVEFLRAVMRQDPIEIMRQIQPFLDANNRQAVVEFLSRLLWWFHDISAIHEGAADRIVNVDMVVSMQKFADHYTEINTEEAIRIIESAIEFTQKNLHLALILIHLVQRLYQCIKPSNKK